MNYKLNKPRRGPVSRFMPGAVCFIVGGFLGLAAGSLVVVREIQASMAVLDIASYATLAPAPDNPSDLQLPLLTGIPLTGDPHLQASLTPQPDTTANYALQSGPTAETPALNSYYNGPELAVR